MSNQPTPTARSVPFVFRGPNTFHFKRKRYPLECLRSIMAEFRTCHPGGGGNWSGHTGDGEAWHKDGDRWEHGWMRVRKIRRGQWAGPWAYKRVREL